MKGSSGSGGSSSTGGMAAVGAQGLHRSPRTSGDLRWGIMCVESRHRVHLAPSHKACLSCVPLGRVPRDGAGSLAPLTAMHKSWGMVGSSTLWSWATSTPLPATPVEPHDLHCWFHSSGLSGAGPTRCHHLWPGIWVGAQGVVHYGARSGRPCSLPPHAAPRTGTL